MPNKPPFNGFIGEIDDHQVKGRGHGLGTDLRAPTRQPGITVRLKPAADKSHVEADEPVFHDMDVNDAGGDPHERSLKVNHVR